MNARAALQKLDEVVATISGDRDFHELVRECILQLAVVVAAHEKRNDSALEPTDVTNG